MKITGNKKTIIAVSTCIVISFLSLFSLFKLTGSKAVIEVCVSMLIPSDSMGSSITMSAKKALTSILKTNTDKNDSEDAVKVNSLAYVPEDIQSLMDNFSSGNETGGKIVPVTYGSDSANTIAGNILVKNTTGRSLNIAEALKQKPSLTGAEEKEISVLIFHTHTTECYQTTDSDTYPKNFSSRNEDENQNMIRVGEEIAEQLKKAGIGVIHDKEIYDRRYTGAYERSGESVDRYLKKYPTIQVVLDVHRDAIQTSETTKVKPVTTISGKKAAQIMIITGCEGGDITDFPNWEDNLHFALQLQKTAEEMYPTLMRPLFFCNRKYNMYKSKCSVLLEMGSDGNTLDEAAYSGRLIGNVLGTMLNKYL